MVLLQRLFSAEIPEPPEWMRPLFTLYVAGFAVLYAVGFLASLHFIFLGPGLGDDFTYRHLAGLVESVRHWSQARETMAPLLALLGLIAFSTGFRAWMVFRGYRDYRRAMGRDFPLRDIVTFGLTNLLNLLFAPVFLLGLAGLALLAGFEPAQGLHALDTLAAWAQAAVHHVPSLFNLPPWPAAVGVLLVWSFAHYWLHRLTHTRRAPWLLLHRPHHMPPDLIYPVTLPVFMSFPFFIVLAFPYLLLVGVLGKLFAPEPPYYQIILIHLVTYVGEIFGHSPALYEEGIRKRWVRAISLLYGQGVYHVLHHSSAVDCERKTSNNTVNIGPGPFFCWDRLFGTYKPLTDKLPPLGLHGNPELVHNPLRLLCAGFMQIAWELWHNRGVVTRLKIIFGPASWTPPLSRDFAVREPLVTEDGTAGTDVAPRTPARRAAAPT